MTQTRYRALKTYLDSVGATLPPLQFIGMVSNLYHRFEAEHYNNRHPEIFKSVTQQHWQELLQSIAAEMPAEIDVLDLGCGTGFASLMALRYLGADRIHRLLCADPSTEMLEKSRAALQEAGFQVEYVAGFIETVRQRNEHFDLILTNSVIHHVFDLDSFFAQIGALLNTDGFYIAGHEPNASHVAVAQVYVCNRLYRQLRRLRRRLNLRVAVRGILRRAGMRAQPTTISDRVNEALLAAGEIRQRLEPAAISKMVDIHVPTIHAERYPWGLPGLDPAGLLAYMPGLSLVASRTYHHIKGYDGLRFPWNWLDQRLAAVYPEAGADFIAVYQKRSSDL